MAITASFNLKASQYDAVNAFINSAMNEQVYVDYPEGMEPFNDVKEPCFLLLRALYGLKQSPLLWLQEVTATLLELGLWRFGMRTGRNCNRQSRFYRKSLSPHWLIIRMNRSSRSPYLIMVLAPKSHQILKQSKTPPTDTQSYLTPPPSDIGITPMVAEKVIEEVLFARML